MRLEDGSEKMSASLESPQLRLSAVARSIFTMANQIHSDPPLGQKFLLNTHAWEVIDVKAVNGIPHVQIVKVGDPTERKLISVSALFDGYEVAAD